MYNIGIDFKLKKEFASYINVLESTDYSIIDLANKQLVQDLDIILIQENTSKELKDICEQILILKAETNALIWVLSTNFNQINRVIYLQLGADLVIDLEQEKTECFILQLKNTLNRLQKNEPLIDAAECTEQKSNSKLELYPDCLRVSIGDQKNIQLTPLEFSTLAILKKHEGELLTYETLFHAIWGDLNEDKQYRVNNLVFHLRKKIEKNTKNPVFIKTIRSRGYMLVL
ncbi:winged helix-turn-helix domain-containing protein [Enterococcus ureasiticus]|uniref:OmpR/PhoB-type domain-containing protein n=1 Tax=Enterococcus ureasiticus TaxID=903984 RepID=A0A1E5G9Y8_9ENTE|nr:winged helix-turn-helix domain-containing protein [Enterococcus ureasiticus]OEG09513.1 hypothetical protein BCR21_14270 [Enterococcus ureasiticus]